MHPCPEKNVCNYAYGRVFLPGLPTQLVQELDVGTVSITLPPYPKLNIPELRL